MVNYVCAKTVPESTKLCVIKAPRSKFPKGASPPDLPSYYMLSRRICTCLPNNPYDLILPHLGHKAERSPDEFITSCVLFAILDRELCEVWYHMADMVLAYILVTYN